MVHKQLYTKVRNPSACVESSWSIWSTIHFRKKRLFDSIKEILAKTAGTFLHQGWFVLYSVSSRYSHHAVWNGGSVLVTVNASKTQPTPMKAHVRVLSLPFELPRLLHGASVRQFPCQLVCHWGSRLADIYSHSRAWIRAHASSSISRKHERWNLKSGTDRYFHATLDNADFEILLAGIAG